MGFLSKIWKGIKNTVKKIGKGIKSAAKSVGKFMNKIGIVGQIALAFILPGIGGLLSRGIGVMAASANPILSGVGKILTTAGKFASTAGNAFRTVTDGITSFVSNIGKGMVNKVGTMLGKDGLIFANGPANVSQGFQRWMEGVSADVSNITSPFKEAAAQVATEAVEAPYKETTSQLFEGGFEDVTTKVSNVVDQPYDPLTNPFKVPDFKPVTENMPFTMDLNRNVIDRIINAEALETKSFMQRVADYSGRLAGRAVETVADSFSQTAGAGLAAEIGLNPQPKTEVTNISNVIPTFDSTPINMAYETAGLSYGALPSNRLQFYAAEQTPVGDYGSGAFSAFTQLRRVA